MLPKLLNTKHNKILYYCGCNSLAPLVLDSRKSMYISVSLVHLQYIENFMWQVFMNLRLH